MQSLKCIVIVSWVIAIQTSAGFASTQSWEKIAADYGLASNEIALLKANRILVSNETYRQIFEAYTNTERPLFITSDSLLNAYHVLFEETILRLETSQARQLPNTLNEVLKNVALQSVEIEGKPKVMPAAKKRARLMLGIALRLIDDSFRFHDVELDTILDAEVAKIQGAELVESPAAWMGEMKPALIKIDYTRFKPRGFYDKSGRLRRYFRAVAWLQAIPFRIDDEEQLVAILLLGAAAGEVKNIEKAWDPYKSFLGLKDDWDLIDATRIASKNKRQIESGDFQEIRKALLSEAKKQNRRPLINDQDRYPPQQQLADPTYVADPNFRIKSAYRTPAAILFTRTTNPGRDLPNSLEVAICLGSGFARKRLERLEPDLELARTILDCQRHFEGDSLYFSYLSALRTLVDEPAKDAPDFMHTEAWEIKSCNTILGGWAQLSHTWILQAKQSMTERGFGDRPPVGFVEPDPEFFSKMADLADATLSILNEAGDLSAGDLDFADSLRQLAGLVEGSDRMEDFAERFSKSELATNHDMRIELIQIKDSAAAQEATDQRAYLRASAQELIKRANDIENGNVDSVDAWRSKMFDVKELWKRFGDISRKLEAIARKQLVGEDLSEPESKFLISYGEKIAEVMLYNDDAMNGPNDDAPRVVDVHTGQVAEEFLHVGVGRPRKFYVLYPWKGGAVLCAGAIMPFHEFADTERHTDESWLRKLEADHQSSIPNWFRPIISNEGRDEPKRLHDRR